MNLETGKVTIPDDWDAYIGDGLACIRAGLRKRRHRLGLTRQQVAETGGVSVTAIRRIEEHTREGFNVDTLLRVASALKLTVVLEDRKEVMPE